jgi:hypothetical protein
VNSLKEERLGIIYKATNKINSKCYIGQTIQKFNNRKAQHKCYAKDKDRKYAFYCAIRKYGWDSFDWEIIYEGNCSDSYLDEMEKFYIWLFDSFKNGYNNEEGGKTNYSVSEETKQKISKNHADVSGENNPNAKKVICLNTNEIFITTVEAGKKYNIDSRNISACCRGNQNTCKGLVFVYYDDYLNNTIPNRTNGERHSHKCKIKCIETGLIFETIKECSLHMNIGSPCICSVLKNKKKHAKGYTFEYVD